MKVELKYNFYFIDKDHVWICFYSISAKQHKITCGLDRNFSGGFRSEDHRYIINQIKIR